MSRRRVIALAAAVSACSVGGPSKPESSSVTLSVDNPLGVLPSAPLRYALAWIETGPRIVTTADGPLESTGTEVTLSMPAASEVERLDPIEQAVVETSTETFAGRVYRPRLVVYEDVNGSGAFELDPDRVLAASRDFIHLGALLDVEGFVRQLPIEQVGLFYRASGGRFSPFVAVSQLSGAWHLDVWQPTVQLELDDSSTPLEALRCPDLATVNGFSSAIVLDQGIDPALCGLYAADCTSTSFAALTPPDVSDVTSSVWTRTAQCQHRAPLQALVVLDQRTTCQDCTCTAESVQTAYVADEGALPRWWPCGTTVEFCDSSQGFVNYHLTCDPP